MLSPYSRQPLLSQHLNRSVCYLENVGKIKENSIYIYNENQTNTKLNQDEFYWIFFKLGNRNLSQEISGRGITSGK